MKHIFFSILTALAFCQCQTPVAAPKNILNCYVRFDAESRIIKAEASLLDGASRKIIEMPGGIRFQSVEMKILPVRGITYTAEYAAAYTAQPIFDWKNKNGQVGKFALEAPFIDSFCFDKPVLSIKKSANLLWVGEPLTKGETLVFIWENTQEGKTVPMEVSSTLGASLIELPAAKIAQVGPGDWSLYLVRKRYRKTEVDDFLVESNGEYYTKPIKIKIRN